MREQVGAPYLSDSMCPNEYPRAISSGADLDRRDRGAGRNSEAGYIPTLLPIRTVDGDGRPAHRWHGGQAVARVGWGTRSCDDRHRGGVTRSSDAVTGSAEISASDRGGTSKCRTDRAAGRVRRVSCRRGWLRRSRIWWSHCLRTGIGQRPRAEQSDSGVGPEEGPRPAGHGWTALVEVE